MNTMMLQSLPALAVQAEQIIEDMGYRYIALEITSVNH